MSERRIKRINYMSKEKPEDKVEPRASCSGHVEPVVMWCFMPVKIVMFVFLLLLLPFFVGVDYGVSDNKKKRYTQFLIKGFKELIRFLTT